MLKARQPAVTAPANFLRLFSANARFRGVWHSPQCAIASARQAPLFHSGLFEPSGSKRLSVLHSADQRIMAQRWLKGSVREIAATDARAGGNLNQSAVIPP